MTCLLGACTSLGPTEILLTTDTDLVVSSDPSQREIDSIRVRIYRLEPDLTDAPLQYEKPGDTPGELAVGDRVRIDDYVYQLRGTLDFAMGPRVLPLEVGVAPEGLDAQRTAYFEALALENGRLVLRTALRTRFVQHRMVRVVLWLSASCVAVDCPPETICRQGSCVPIEVDTSCLHSVTSDAGGDCSSDAGTSCSPPCAGTAVCVAGRCAERDDDRDRLPASIDCDDHDASVGRLDTRACTGPCGSALTQNCADGLWDACVAPGCECAATDTRQIPCGDCSLQAQRCTAGSWTNQGACAMGCTAANGTASCNAGACTLDGCNAGFADCDAQYTDGCETDLATDPANCGACNTRGTEICNGTDDDCDGTADNGFTCAAGSNGNCTSSCGSTGRRPCRADCTWGACAPPAEQCGNGVDDNCDGNIDEGCCTGCCGGAAPGSRQPGHNTWSACDQCVCGDCAATSGMSCGGCGRCVACWQTCSGGSWVDDSWCAGRSDC